MTRAVLTWIGLSVGAGLLIGLVRSHLGYVPPPRSLFTEALQGFLAGVATGLITVQLVVRFTASRVNGWVTMLGCGEPGRGALFRAACAMVFPGPVNLAEEAVYFRTDRDGDGRPLDGRRHYRLHFEPGGLPPNRAFWSLTMGDARNRFVANPLDRYSVGDRSGLAPNADGSVDVYLQSEAPADHEANWLPAPRGRFILWLRVYLPTADVVAGRYEVPPVTLHEASAAGPR